MSYVESPKISVDLKKKIMEDANKQREPRGYQHAQEEEEGRLTRAYEQANSETSEHRTMHTAPRQPGASGSPHGAAEDPGPPARRAADPIDLQATRTLAPPSPAIPATIPPSTPHRDC